MVGILGVMSSMTACTNVAVSGAQAIYNHKSLQDNINDTVMALRATHVLNHPQFDDAKISIATLNSEVLLTGEAPQPWQKERATELVNKVKGVKGVYNYITYSSPASALSQASDAWLTTKVKGKIIASYNIDATRIKVVTEKGKVYLMGTLTPEEAEEVMTIANTTDGVRSVVKLFSYIKLTKTL